MAVPSTWHVFLRALAEELDANSDAAARRRLLRGIGHRMARMTPLGDVTSLEALEMVLNDALAQLGWGQVALSMSEADNCLVLTHGGLPRIGAAGDPPGTWLAPVLEGLYDGWMAQQPGSDPSLSAQLQPGLSATSLILRYGRA